MKEVTIASPLGPLTIKGNHGGITEIFFDHPTQSISREIPEELIQAAQELTEYFENKRTEFQLTLHPKGTEFQKKVWKTLLTIPFGSQKSYLEVAKKLGDPKVIRAAATANGKNPIAIVIPCHRVVGSDGSLVGYAGGLSRKKWLLSHESPVKQGELF